MFDEFLRGQIVEANTKIVMLILDGLGGLPREEGGKTELETACKPNMDALASKSALGMTIPAGPGITVGSGPGHLSIFGFNPLEYQIGRGALEALGVDFELGPDDVAGRGNFCLVNENGLLVDRRAGRLPTCDSERLVQKLRTIKLKGAEVFVEIVKEHRFVLVLRAPGLGTALTDSDPLVTGAAPLKVQALDDASKQTAALVNAFLEQAEVLLKNEKSANMVLLRGFAKFPVMPKYPDIYKLNAAAIAVNGMYRGVSRLVGMNVLPVDGTELSDEFDCLEKHWSEYDFFYLHFKKTDTYGEIGDFDAKVKAIEEFDAQLPRLMALNPDVVIIGGDHSSPAVLKSHSWHPVPLLMYAKYVRADKFTEFGETNCTNGNLGQIPAYHVMPIALANAGRVAKYGA
jgi:2,3-bisphosphoglycerate-independent phosphoglycerate mutase